MYTKIDVELVRKLITEKFPKFKGLKISLVEHGGVDNRTFYLGDDMSVRLPSSEAYASQAQKEYKWLPVISSFLTSTISIPLYLGNPSKYYPWKWSIYKWLDGKSANLLNDNELDFNNIAISLAKFIKELHDVDITDAPKSGKHNFYRGSHISVYNDDFIDTLQKTESIINKDKALEIWQQAKESRWSEDPVWCHGDLYSGNFLIKDKKFAAVIDFGCIAIGDPACDLVPYWTFFDSESSQVFKEKLSIDSKTWQRARAWALWKANFELASSEVDSEKYKEQLKVINKILICE